MKYFNDCEREFDGITFVDIEKCDTNWKFNDSTCQRIPSKGEVMHFRYTHSGKKYYGEVLYVIDNRKMLGSAFKEGTKVDSMSITVILQEIKCELKGNIYQNIMHHLYNMDVKHKEVLTEKTK